MAASNRIDPAHVDIRTGGQVIDNLDDVVDPHSQQRALHQPGPQAQ
jgi:hypothetical protein